MKSLAFIVAFLGLLNLMTLALTTDLHTTYHDASAALVPVNKNQLPKPNVARDPPTPPTPPPPPGPDPPPGPGLNVVDYNLRNPNFRIPPFVLCPRDGNILQDPADGWPGGRQNPRVGGRALEPMFSADEVWAAFNQGWQRLMDASRAGGYNPNVIPPFTGANQAFWNYAQSHWPRWQAGQYFPSEVQSDIWDDIFDWAGWPDESDLGSIRIFLYPLTIQGHFDGGNSAPADSNERVVAPGDYRVVFTDSGTYLGVVRYRPGLPNAYGVLDRTTPRTYLRASWLAPVDANQLPIAAQDHAGRWNYPGVPLWVSQLPENFLPPLNVALASVLLQRWNRFAHPGGSQPPPRRQDDGVLYLPGVDDNDPDNAIVDDRGFYQFDGNATSDTSTDPPVEEINNMRCRTALIAVNRTYQVSCESNQNDGSHTLDYHIAVTGIGEGGYYARGWCKGIIDNINRYCSWDFNLVGDVNCDTGNATVATWFMDNSIRGEYINHISGVEMWFTLRPPWDSSDNNHECIAKAIQRGSCATQGIVINTYQMPTYPVVCRRKDWFDLELNEWSWANLGEA